MVDQTFDEAKEILELKHQHRMDELLYYRGTEKLKHEWEMERFRIMNAERKKFLEKKASFGNRFTR